MRLPPIPLGQIPLYAKAPLAVRQWPYYNHPGVPYRQGEEELQQPVVYAPNYYYGYGSNNPWLTHTGGGYWQSNYFPQSHYNYSNMPAHKPRPSGSDLVKEQLKTLQEKKLQERKLASKILQQKSMAERGRLEKSNSKIMTSLNNSIKGSATNRAGFGPSGNALHASAAA